MKRRPLLDVGAAFVLGATLATVAASCGRRETPSQVEPPGHEKKGDTKALETTAGIVQDLTPVRELDHYLDGFHVMKHDPSLVMEAHHYCRGINEEVTQCVIFDGTTKTANLVGVEYIVSERLFESLPDEEKAMWHPHNYEILSGQLVMPGIPARAEKAALAKKINSYGKTWHLWDTGHHGHPAAQPLPVGQPLLAWSFNHDEEMPRDLLEARDRRLEIDTTEKRRDRTDLANGARPQRGVDDIAGALGGKTAPPGVMPKR